MIICLIKRLGGRLEWLSLQTQRQALEPPGFFKNSLSRGFQIHQNEWKGGQEENEGPLEALKHCFISCRRAWQRSPYDFLAVSRDNQLTSSALQWTLWAASSETANALPPFHIIVSNRMLLYPRIIVTIDTWECLDHSSSAVTWCFWSKSAELNS